MIAPSAVSQSLTLEAPSMEGRASPLAIGSWSLYDFANTMFSLNVVSTYFPLFVKERGQDDAVYAYPMSAALLVVALIMPWLGALSDRMGRRMPSLIGFTFLCVAATALMGLVTDLWMVIALYMVASIGYQTALVFYDALLPSVSTTLNWGKVSGLGVGLGYAGALAGLTIASAIVGEGSNQIAFLPTAGLFLMFAIPCFLFVRERRASPSPQSAAVEQQQSRPRAGWRDAVTQTAHALREARKVPGLFRFLVANFFYSDALNTVIIAMSVYSVEVIGFSSPLAVLAPAIVAAVLGSWLFGFVTDWITAKWSLVVSLTMWIGVFLAAMFITDRIIFQWLIAPLAGIALGSTWTAARTMMVELSPPERLGEFMGIYNLTGKFAAVLSPILWGTTLLIINPREYGQFAYQVAIGTLLVMVVIGLALHLRTPSIRRVRGASAEC